MKQYIKLLVIINVFFLIFALGITWEESQVDPGAGYYGGFFTWTFLPALLFFLILYGIYSYIKTNKIFLPNLLLMVFMDLYFCWIFCLTPLATKTLDGEYIFFLLTRGPVFIAVSAIAGILVKLILWLKNRSRTGDGSVS